MLNLDSPKLFNMEMGRQTWECRCSGVLLQQGGLHQNQHPPGVPEVVPPLSPSQPTRPSSMCFTVLSGPGCNLPCSWFCNEVVVTGITALIYSGLRGMDEEA